MALVMNASNEIATFRVFGNHFTLKPGQIKSFQENIARFISINETTKNLGLVTLPDELEDLDMRQSPEGKAILEDKKKDGVNNRIAFLRQLVYNNQVSLRQDLEKANIKADPRVFASSGEMGAYEELVKYQAKKEDEDQKKVARIKALEDQLKE
jgi:hypothetical protein